jgi:hypothetical protein
MVVDIREADFAWHEIHRRLLDLADQQLIDDHLTVVNAIDALDNAVLTANGYRRGERTGGHNDCDGKPGRFQRLECSNQYDDINRQPGGWRQLERSNRHDDLDGNPGGWRQLKRSNRYDDLDGHPGRIGQFECADDNGNDLRDIGG